MNQYHKKDIQKKLTKCKCTYVQGQILHSATQRKIRLSLILTRLPDEETQTGGLCIFQTYIPT